MTDPAHLIIIGAQRAGSTWLYETLNAHPKVWMNRPTKPEPKYFLNKKVNKVDYLNTVFSTHSHDVQYLGEKSTSYYEHPEVASRIASCLDQVKILVILRNPVYRAISNYQFTKDSGLETRELREVFVQEKAMPPIPPNISVNPFDYLARGYYAELLTPFMKTFRDRFKALIFEEVVQGIGEGDLWDFLELSPSKQVNKVVNPSSSIQVEEDVIEVLTEHYLPHIHLLERLLDRNLDIWKP